MKYKKIVIVPERQENKIVKVTCDLCKSEIKATGCYEVDEVTIEWDIGSHYPEGRFIERHSIDMCGDCFKSKLTPWLDSQGADVLITDPD